MLPTSEEVAFLKMKLAKGKRTQKDWQEIQSLLENRDLIVPENPDARGTYRLSVMNNFIPAFTNMEDYNRQMKVLSRALSSGIDFRPAYVSCVELVNMSDNIEKYLYIDMIADGKTRFLIYFKEHIDAGIMRSNVFPS